MNRYCTKCNKEYDFKIVSMDELDNLKCPVCGSKIDKNSRKPRDIEAETKVEETIGEGFYMIFKFAYFFYLICGVIGVAAYFLGLDKLLFADTVICLVTYLMRYGRSYDYRGLDMMWIVGGAGIGYYYFRTVQGACLGIMVGLILRHIVKTIIYRLLSKFIHWCMRL